MKVKLRVIFSGPWDQKIRKRRKGGPMCVLLSPLPPPWMRGGADGRWEQRSQPSPGCISQAQKSLIACSHPAFGHAPAWICPWRPCAGRRLLRSKVFLRAWHHHHAPRGFPVRSLSGKCPQCLYGETLFYFGFAFDKIYWHEFSNFCKVLWVTVTRAPVVLPRI